MIDSLANLDMTACYLMPSSPNFSQKYWKLEAKEVSSSSYPHPQEKIAAWFLSFSKMLKKKKK